MTTIDVYFDCCNYWGYKVYRSVKYDTPIVYDGNNFFTLTDNNDIDSDLDRQFKDEVINIVNNYKMKKEMENVLVLFKKLNKNAVIPKYAKDGDAGMDLVATSVEYDKEIDAFVYHTGIAVEIPRGYYMQILPRSSNRKTDAYMTNHVGVIDSGYRGEILVTFKNRTSTNSLVNNLAFSHLINSIVTPKESKNDKDETIQTYACILEYARNVVLSIDATINDEKLYDKILPYQVGDRIAQAIVLPYPFVSFVEVAELSESERGEGGHGSTGK